MERGQFGVLRFWGRRRKAVYFSLVCLDIRLQVQFLGQGQELFVNGKLVRIEWKLLEQLPVIVAGFRYAIQWGQFLAEIETEPQSLLR